MKIDQKDLPLQVQKGLLFIKEMPKSMERLIQQDKAEFTYQPLTEGMESQIKNVMNDTTANNLVKNE